MASINPVAIDTEIAKLDSERDGILRRLAQIDKRSAELTKVYSEHRWTRFYPAVTNSTPHIHSSTGCQTLHRGQYMTTMTWATQMSGQTEAQAVADLDEALCSVCFPSAPVALREDYVSRKSQAAKDERAAEKAARDDAKSLKNLTEDETKRFASIPGIGRYDAPTTVAAAKVLVRKSAETLVELGWYTSGDAARSMTKANGWMDAQDVAEHVARQTRNRRAALVTDTAAAVMAAEILADREAARPGSGQTREASAKAQENAGKRTAKSYASI